MNRGYTFKVRTRPGGNGFMYLYVCTEESKGFSCGRGSGDIRTE